MAGKETTMAIPSYESNTGARFVDAGSAQRARTEAREAIDRLSTSAGDTVDRLATGAQDALDRAAGTASEYVDRGLRLREDARDWIAAYPWRAMGIAAATGFVLVRMLR
jgi:ElaB/YqjD/DUF883 family membrane-anchored ribosome-binding protein